jgi:hypothetical protein
MPYITSKRRVEVAPHAEVAETPGELSFQVTLLLTRYLRHHGVEYRSLNDVLGVLEGAKQELYRRLVAPYEDFKMDAYGDVGYQALLTTAAPTKGTR